MHEIIIIKISLELQWKYLYGGRVKEINKITHTYIHAYELIRALKTTQGFTRNCFRFMLMLWAHINLNKCLRKFII